MSPSKSCPNSAWDGTQKIWNIKLYRQKTSPRGCGERPQGSVGNKWTAAVFERTECFLRWNGAAQFVDVTRIFRFLGSFHLEQISRVNLAAVSADIALAEQRILGRYFLHLADDGLSVIFGLQGGDGLEIVQGRGVIACLIHAWEFSGHLGLPAFCPGTAVIVHVPIECLGKNEALRNLQTERLHIADVEQQRREVLAARRDAKLRALLDRVNGIAAGIGKTDDLGFR